MIPRKKHLTLDITCMTCREAAGLLMNFYIVWNFHARCTQRLLSVKFVGKSKYCQKSLKLGKGQPVPISSIFYFKIVGRAYENRKRGDLLTGSECWEFFFSFLLAYLLFSEVEFFKSYYQDKTIIVKNGFLKISVTKNVQQNPIMKVWTNIVFRAASNLPNRLSFTT